MKNMLAVLLAISCFSMASLASAAHPLTSDDAGTTGTMNFQVETSAEFGWENESGATSDYQKLMVAATAGVRDSLDLVLCYPFTWQRIEDSSGNRLDKSGLNDVSLAFKWRLLELGPVSFAIKPSITFPTADRNRSLGAGRAAYGATLISTVEFKAVAIHANAGYTHQKYTDADQDDSRESIWNMSLAGGVEVMDGLQLVAEAGTATNPDRSSGTWRTFMAGGLIYSASHNMDVSLGVKGGLTTPETDIALLSGITIKLP